MRIYTNDIEKKKSSLEEEKGCARKTVRIQILITNLRIRET